MELNEDVASECTVRRGDITSASPWRHDASPWRTVTDRLTGPDLPSLDIAKLNGQNKDSLAANKRDVSRVWDSGINITLVVVHGWSHTVSPMIVLMSLLLLLLNQQSSALIFHRCYCVTVIVPAILSFKQARPTSNFNTMCKMVSIRVPTFFSGNLACDKKSSLLNSGRHLRLWQSLSRLEANVVTASRYLSGRGVMLTHYSEACGRLLRCSKQSTHCLQRRHSIFS